MDLKREGSDSSLNPMEDLSATHSLARKMDAEDRVAKRAAKSGGEGALAVPMTNFGARGLSMGAPRDKTQPSANSNSLASALENNSAPKPNTYQRATSTPSSTTASAPAGPPVRAVSGPGRSNASTTKRRGLAGKRGVSPNNRARTGNKLDDSASTLEASLNASHNLVDDSTSNLQDDMNAAMNASNSLVDAMNVIHEKERGRKVSVVKVSEPSLRAITTAAGAINSKKSAAPPNGPGSLERDGSTLSSDIAAHMSLEGLPDAPPLLMNSKRESLEKDDSGAGDIAMHTGLDKLKQPPNNTSLDQFSMDMDNANDSTISNPTKGLAREEAPVPTPTLGYTKSTVSRELSTPDVVGPDGLSTVNEGVVTSAPYGGMDDSSIMNRLRGSDEKPGSQMTKLAPAMSRGHRKNGSMDDSSNNGSRGGSSRREDTTIPMPRLQQGTTKGLAQAPPGSQMTKLAPATSRGHRKNGSMDDSSNNGRGGKIRSTTTSVEPGAHAVKPTQVVEPTVADVKNPPSNDSASGQDNEDNVDAATRADRNEMRRLKFGLTNNIQQEGTATVPSVAARAAAPDVVMGTAHGPSIEKSAKSLETEVSCHLPNSSSSDLKVSTSNLVPRHSVVQGPGAYRVELQQQQRLSSARSELVGQQASARSEIVGQLASARSAAVERSMRSLGNFDENEIEEERSPSMLGKRSKWTIAIGCAMVLVIVVAVVIAVMPSGGDGSGDGGSVSATLPPEAASPANEENDPSRPPDTDMDTFLWSLLPETTIASIENDMNSPQALANDWLLQDPSVTRYSATVLLQRFSLSTLYFSANGPEWLNGGNWLEYDQNECDWEGATCGGNRGTIEQLNLDSNQLNGTLPAEISFLTDLKTLDVSKNEMQGSMPSEIGLMTNLQRIYLQENTLTGQMPTELGELDKLVHFMADYNRLSGTLPREFGQMGTSSLRKLTVMRNKLIGTIPLTLSSLSALEELNLSNTTLTGPIPQDLPPNLEDIDFGWIGLELPGLSGTIPTQIGLLTKLTALKLFASVDLIGPIPSELGLATELYDLELDHNLLTGTIPTEIGNLKRLYHFVLTKTLLTGPIPSELGLCTDLFEFYADETGLSGSIPTELANLQGLLKYNLANTDLTGTVPYEPFCTAPVRGLDCGKTCGCDGCPCPT